MRRCAWPTRSAFRSPTTSTSSSASTSRSISGAAIKADQALGHAFADARLLQQAFTHRSAGRPNNERLEFLGDSLLNLIVAELIFQSHPRADEGEMTRLRASLVNGAALAGRAREEAFPERLRLGSGEMKSGGHRRDSILADAYEAVVAAIYLDGGWNACREAVRARFGAAVEAAPRRTEKDPKTRLQELLQSEGLPVPTYELVASRGEEHARVFEAQCWIEAFSIRTAGEASSRRAAEQIAAAAALDQLIEKLDR